MFWDKKKYEKSVAKTLQNFSSLAEEVMGDQTKRTLMSYHNPVMLKECINGLNIKPNGVYVDATFGGGGHSKAIVLSGGRLYSFDQDLDVNQNLFQDKRFKFLNQTLDI